MNPSLSLAGVAKLVGGELRGDPDIEIHGVATVSSAQSGDLTWVSSAKYAGQLRDCRAAAVLVPPQIDPGRVPAVVCPSPDAAIAVVLGRLQRPLPHPPVGIDPSATVGRGVELEEGVAVGPRVTLQDHVRVGRGTVLHAGVFVGEETILGSDCVLWPNVVVRERCQIGDRVIIHANATIGADGFGYQLTAEGTYQRIAHIGTVRIEHDVEIGANSCIDRSKCGETVIGRGTKIDNLVQIAHNVHIGPHCCIIAQVGIAGSTTLGHHVVLAGKVGVNDHVSIGNGVVVAACSCVSANAPDKAVLLGTPAVAKEQFVRERAAARHMPSVRRQLRELLARVEKLEQLDQTGERA